MLKIPYHQSLLFKVKSKKRLAEILGFPIEKIDSVIKDLENFYFIKEFQDKKGKPRIAYMPRKELTKIQSKILSILKKIQAPDYMHYATEGRSYITNASQHKNSTSLAKIDIKNFFPSTNYLHVYDFFHNYLKCSKEVAKRLAKLCTYKDSLPTGNSLSPLLSQFAHIKMFDKINILAESQGIKFTLFGDDIGLSGSGSHKLHWEVKKMIHHRGMSYHKNKKSKKYHPHQEKIITGVVIKDGKKQIKKESLELIYKELELLESEKGKEYPETFIVSLRGKINQAIQVSLENIPLLDRFNKAIK